jgi:hypothetical protein
MPVFHIQQVAVMLCFVAFVICTAQAGVGTVFWTALEMRAVQVGLAVSRVVVMTNYAVMFWFLAVAICAAPACVVAVV